MHLMDTDTCLRMIANIEIEWSDAATQDKRDQLVKDTVEIVDKYVFDDHIQHAEAVRRIAYRLATERGLGTLLIDDRWVWASDKGLFY